MLWLIWWRLSSDPCPTRTPLTRVYCALRVALVDGVQSLYSGCIRAPLVSGAHVAPFRLLSMARSHRPTCGPGRPRLAVVCAPVRSAVLPFAALLALVASSFSCAACVVCWCSVRHTAVHPGGTVRCPPCPRAFRCCRPRPGTRVVPRPPHSWPPCGAPCHVPLTPVDACRPSLRLPLYTGRAPLAAPVIARCPRTRLSPWPFWPRAGRCSPLTR